MLIEMEFNMQNALACGSGGSFAPISAKARVQFAEFTLLADVSAFLRWLHNSVTDIYQQQLGNQEQRQRPP